MTDQVPPRPGGFSVGSRVAGYRIDAELGRGGMAVVYRAHDPRLERGVALKVLAPDLAGDQAFRQRFIRESRAAAAVDHPNIIPIFEAGEANGVLFIAMRLVGAGDVQTLIDRHGPLPPEQVCAIVAQVASALDAAHTHGLVHRDVKPANMLLDDTGDDRAGHVYLSDFGLSKRALGGTELTSAGEFLGTLNYVAPEQIEGKPVDGRTDLYALACSAYAMLAGAPPFRREDSAALMWAQLSTAPPPLSSRRPGLPAAVDDVLAKALAKSPADRHATCRVFAAALRRACGLEPGDAQPAQPPPAGREATRPVGPADLAAAAAAAGARPPAPGIPPHPAATGDPASLPPPPDATRAAGVPAGTAGSAGPPTQFAAGAPAGHVLDRPRGPGGTIQEGYSVPGRAPGRRSRRVPAIIAVGVMAVLGATGGYLLFGRGSPARHSTVAAVALPACSPAVTAKAGTLPGVPHHLVPIGGHPFDVAATRGFAFASTDGQIAVLSLAHPVPSVLWHVSAPHSGGEVITHDQRYLIVTGGNGAMVFSVASLEQSASATPLGRLASPGQQHAVEVAITPDDRFVFITYQNSAHVGVFSFRRAVRSGFGPGSLVGVVPVGTRPVGVAVSPDGRYAYVASGRPGAPYHGLPGMVSVIDVRKAGQRPATAVVATVAAGCLPTRVLPSTDGKYLYVTEGGANSLLLFSAPKLLGDARHALLGHVRVGQYPLGLVLARHGTRLVVADSNRDHVSTGASSLAVVDTARLLAGRPSLVGYLPAGTTPKQFALAPDGHTLLVTSTDSAQIEALDLAHLR